MFSIQYKRDYNPEGEQEEQDVTNLQTATSHSPANLVLSHKAKARARAPFPQHNPGYMGWDQQEEAMGSKHCRDKTGKEDGRSVHLQVIILSTIQIWF